MRKNIQSVIKAGQGPLITISIASFFESIISPVPVDPALVGLLVKNPHWKSRLWISVSLASVLGAIVSYYVGCVLYEAVGKPIICFYNLSQGFELFAQWVHEYGFCAMLAKPFLPFPFKFAAMVFGVVEYNFWLFLLATIISRPIRFFVVTCLVLRFGMRYRAWLLRRLSWIRVGYMVAILGFFVLLAVRACF